MEWVILGIKVFLLVLVAFCFILFLYVLFIDSKFLWIKTLYFGLSSIEDGKGNVIIATKKQKNGKLCYGAIKGFRIIIPFGYDKLFFEGEDFIATLNGKVGVLCEHAVLVDLAFDSVQKEHGLWIVEQNGLFHVFGVSMGRYSYLEVLTNKLIAVGNDDSEWVIGLDGQPIVDDKAESVRFLEDDCYEPMLVFIKEDHCYVYTTKGDFLFSTPFYVEAVPKRDRVIVSRYYDNESLLGMIDFAGNFIEDFLYEEIEDGYLVLRKEI